MYLIHGPFSHPRIIHSAIQFIKSIMLYRYIWVKAILHVWLGPSSSIWSLNILNKNVHPNGFRVYNNIFARQKSQCPRPLKSQVSHALGRLGRMESILTQHRTTISKLLSYLWMTSEWLDLEDPCNSCMLY